jgi:hypothetical protein
MKTSTSLLAVTLLFLGGSVSLGCSTTAGQGRGAGPPPESAGQASSPQAQHNPPARTPESDPENQERRFGFAAERARKQARAQEHDHSDLGVVGAAPAKASCGCEKADCVCKTGCSCKKPASGK